MTEQSLEEAIVGELLLLMRQHRRASRRQHQELGISGRQSAALRYLAQTGPHTVSEISRYLYISDPSTSELLDHMQKKGYTKRERCADDNRKVYVSATELGLETALKTEPGIVGRLREGLPELSREELEQINRVLQKLGNMAGLHDRD